MKFLDFLKGCVYKCSLAFSLIILSFSLLSELANTSDSFYVPTFWALMTILLFSAFLAVILELAKIIKINKVLCKTLVFVLAYADFFLCFFAIPKKLEDIGQLIFMSIIFTVLFFAFLLFGALLDAVQKKHESKNRTESIFDKK